MSTFHRTLLLVGLMLAIGVLTRPRVAAAYPQLVSVDNPRCSSCHLSPAGGNLLNENGLAVAEAQSQFGTDPTFFYDKLPTPAWLTLGGAVRAAGGFVSTPENVLAAFPMQTEVFAAARWNHLSLHVTAGGRPRSEAEDPAPPVWSREHYVMWSQEAGGQTGSFARVGRFMPVFGLRLAEHPMYTRRWGGVPLYGETYGLHVAHVADRWEAHVTGFIEDPVIAPVELTRGGAAYAEVRLTDALTLGAEGMYQRTDDDQKIRGGAIAKVHVPAARLLVQGEVQFVNQLIDETPGNPDGGAPPQIVASVVGSLGLTDYLLLDLGLGHFDENVRIRDLDRDAVDVNLHYFVTSHVELVWNARYEMIGLSKGGPSSGYSLLQLHYRL